MVASTNLNFLFPARKGIYANAGLGHPRFGFHRLDYAGHLPVFKNSQKSQA